MIEKWKRKRKEWEQDGKRAEKDEKGNKEEKYLRWYGRWEKMVWHGKKRAETLGGDRVEVQMI